VLKSIRVILSEVGGLAGRIEQLEPDADLYRAGLKSLAVARVMVALEQEYGVEFKSEMLDRATFSSISAIERALNSLGARVVSNEGG
jgi:acyl carrier protein